MAQQFNGFLVVRDFNEKLDMKAGELLDAIYSGKNDDGTYSFVAGPTTYSADTADDYPESE